MSGSDIVTILIYGPSVCHVVAKNQCASRPLIDENLDMQRYDQMKSMTLS